MAIAARIQEAVDPGQPVVIGARGDGQGVDGQHQQNPQAGQRPQQLHIHIGKIHHHRKQKDDHQKRSGFALKQNNRAGYQYHQESTDKGAGIR